MIAFAVVGGVWLASLRGDRAADRGPSRDAGVASRSGGALARRCWCWSRLRSARCSASTEVVTVAFAQEQGHAALAGALLAVWASGSLIAGHHHRQRAVEVDAAASLPAGARSGWPA